MKLALRLPPSGSLRPHTYATLIGLLWVSGLRGGEAVRLNLEDVDLEQGILYIRQVDGTFRSLTRELELKSAGTGEPRLHDLRHTWATRCLAGLYQTGQDPNAWLPVLATYLGHMNIACTTVYLHPAPDLLVQAGSQFRNYVMQTANPGGGHE